MKLFRYVFFFRPRMTLPCTRFLSSSWGSMRINFVFNRKTVFLESEKGQTSSIAHPDKLTQWAFFALDAALSTRVLCWGYNFLVSRQIPVIKDEALRTLNGEKTASLQSRKYLNSVRVTKSKLPASHEIMELESLREYQWKPSDTWRIFRLGAGKMRIGIRLYLHFLSEPRRV